MPSANIIFTPRGNKQLEEEETLAPYQSDMRNGVMTDAGNWKKRNGYNSGDYNLSVNETVDLLIPSNDIISHRYSVTLQGRVFQLTPVVLELTGARLSGGFRPTYTVYDDKVIICDGGQPVKIHNNASSLLGGTPPYGKFVDRITSYVLMAGQDDYSVRWSQAGAFPEVWPALNTKDVQKVGGKIRNLKAKNTLVYIWKSKSIEVWDLTGGSATFTNLDNHEINIGTAADYSVVGANDTFYWFGHDYKFYGLEGSVKVISRDYEKNIFSLVDPESIYGFDFTKEGVIRWFAQTDGKCYVYDYVHKTFYEDNTWNHGQFERLPINSYMEDGNNQYFGDYDPTGLVYNWSSDSLDDNGNEIRVYRKLSYQFNQDGKRAKVNNLRLRFKSGVASATETSPTMNIRWRFDKKDWTRYHEIDLGSIGEHEGIHVIYNMGYGMVMDLEIIETDAVNFLLTHGIIEWDELDK